MFDAPSSEWFVRETGVMIAVPELWGHLFIGRTKEGVSLNKVMNGYAGWASERHIALDVFPILADGVKWMGYLPEQRIFWNVGAYGDWFRKDNPSPLIGRKLLVALPGFPSTQRKNKRYCILAQIFVMGSQRMTRSGYALALRPTLLLTLLIRGLFIATIRPHFGYEAYYTRKSLMIGSEYYLAQF